MKRIRLKAPAKINLSLDVLGRRPDGYHELDMIMQTVALFDRVEIQLMETEAGETGCSAEEQPAVPNGCIEVVCLQNGVLHPEVPSDERNLAWKAARRFFDAACEAGVCDAGAHPGVRVTVDKRIPAAAGLAGGSTDAAAVLVGLNRLTGEPFDAEGLAAIGLKLGADVPYCLTGGTCRAQGVGERLTPTQGLGRLHVVLAKPPFPLSTASVFGGFLMNEAGRRPDTETLLACIRRGGAEDARQLAAGMANVLESVSFRLHPEIGGLVDRMRSLGAIGSRMSGSGPTVFGLFETAEQAEMAARMLEREWPGEDGLEVHITEIHHGGIIHG